jgi:hypothetical protein
MANDVERAWKESASGILRESTPFAWMDWEELWNISGTSTSCSILESNTRQWRYRLSQTARLRYMIYNKWLPYYYCGSSALCWSLRAFSVLVSIHSRQNSLDGASDSRKAAIYTINSVAWVRKQTIPTERPPLVGEVSANFCGYMVPRCQRDGSLRSYSRIF